MVNLDKNDKGIMKNHFEIDPIIKSYHSEAKDIGRKCVDLIDTGKQDANLNIRYGKLERAIKNLILDKRLNEDQRKILNQCYDYISYTYLKYIHSLGKANNVGFSLEGIEELS